MFGSAPPVSTSSPPGIAVEDVTTILAGVPVLHRLRLSVTAGQLTVLMGPSGSGKTTLMRHVIGLLEPDAGSVIIGGRDVWTVSRKLRTEIQRGISPMLGGGSLYDTYLFGSLTVRGNVVQALKAAGVPRNEWSRRGSERLVELGLEAYLDALPSQLPSHARRRLALARALVVDAPLTILDEIDVGLDSAHHHMVVEAVRGLRRRTGGTVLLTTHSLDLARELGDELAVLMNGRIVLSGPKDEILDGVPDGPEFLRSIELHDYSGPGRLAAARLAVPSTDRRRFSDLPANPWLVLAALFVVLAVVIGLTALLS